MRESLSGSILVPWMHQTGERLTHPTRNALRKSVMCISGRYVMGLPIDIHARNPRQVPQSCNVNIKTHWRVSTSARAVTLLASRSWAFRAKCSDASTGPPNWCCSSGIYRAHNARIANVFISSTQFVWRSIKKLGRWMKANSGNMSRKTWQALCTRFSSIPCRLACLFASSGKSEPSSPSLDARDCWKERRMELWAASVLDNSFGVVALWEFCAFFFLVWLDRVWGSLRMHCLWGMVEHARHGACPLWWHLIFDFLYESEQCQGVGLHMQVLGKRFTYRHHWQAIVIRIMFYNYTSKANRKWDFRPDCELKD